jgi:hypothetical protein
MENRKTAASMTRLRPLKRKYRELGADLKDGLKQNFRLARALPAFFRARVTVEQAEDEIKRALDGRAERFLESTRLRIYGRPGSPYWKLLKFAGCEWSDLRANVHGHGLEATLERLAREGVYLTADEFKGKKDICRGRESFRASLTDFEFADTGAGLVTQTSGTTGAPVRSTISLDRIAVQTAETAVFFAAHDLFSRVHGTYDAILPAGGGIRNLLVYAKMGIATERWFARTVPTSSLLGGLYQYLSTYLIVMVGKWYGPGFPRPEFLRIEELDRIVRWAAEKQAEGRTCCIKAAASNATRIAQTAREMGVFLGGVKFIVGGEPFTDAKSAVIRDAGAGATVHYAFSGGGTVGNGCARPLYPDDVHINQHTFAVVLHPEPSNRDGVPIRPLLFTTLLDNSPRLLLNVENGDCGILEERDCGCALGRVGLTQHLHRIRSYEKFTSEGMNYFYGDLFEIFEKTLPAEFGGGPGDYQLVEEEDDRGQTRLTLRVHPDVPNLNENVLLRRLHEELAKGSRANEFGAKVWQDAGTLRVRREIPHASARGKILPLHISRFS